MNTADQLSYTLFYHPTGYAAVYGATYASDGSGSVPGWGFSSNTAKFLFSQKLRYAKFARWVLLWASQHTAARARLIHFDDGPTNMIAVRGGWSGGGEVTEIPGQGHNTPFVDALDFTEVYNELVRKGVDKHIGHQFKDNGSNGSIIGKSYLEITLA